MHVFVSFCSWYYHFLSPALHRLWLAFNISFADLSIFVIMCPGVSDPSTGAASTAGLPTSGVLQIGVISA